MTHFILRNFCFCGCNFVLGFLEPPFETFFIISLISALSVSSFSVITFIISFLRWEQKNFSFAVNWLLLTILITPLLKEMMYITSSLPFLQHRERLLNNLFRGALSILQEYEVLRYIAMIYIFFSVIAKNASWLQF